MDRNEQILDDYIAGHTYQVIGDKHGISRERVRQIIYKQVGNEVVHLKEANRSERVKKTLEEMEERRMRKLAEKEERQIQLAIAKQAKKQEVIERHKPETRFWKRVKKTDGCWYWLGGLTASGYGHFRYINGNILCHRYIYEQTYGALGDKVIVHTCKNTVCVRPDHLKATTFIEAMRGRVARKVIKKKVCVRGHDLNKFRDKWPSGGTHCSECNRLRNRKGFERVIRTTCPQGHPKTKENTYVSPAGLRQCKPCSRMRSLAFMNARRAEVVKVRNSLK